ncbi:MAG: Snf7 family protein [Promethearchaeota archaeon]
MGKITEFLQWLSGEDNGSKSSFSHRNKYYGSKNAHGRNRQMLFKLKLQIKRMQKQQKKLEFQADKSKKKAIDAKKNGDDDRAKMYAREMVKYRKLSVNLGNFISGLENMKFKLEQVTETQKMADMFKMIDQSLQGMKMSVSVPEIQETLDSINQTITDMDATLEVTKDGLEITSDSNVSEKEVDLAMAEIDTELASEATELPSAGVAVEDGKISELKKKIDALKD